MNLIQQLYNSFLSFGKNRAFCIDGKDITYFKFLEYINGIYNLIEKNISGKNNGIGIIAFETIETYAAFFACWFSGNYFVPINPKHPLERNKAIIKETGVKIVLTSKDEVSEIIYSGNVASLNIRGLKESGNKNPEESNGNQLLYILTTSGSTGVPKHVPINAKNVEAYCNAYFKVFPELDQKACVLQTHDHTTDASFTSYLLPLLKGACIYFLPEGQFKFLSIARMMLDKKITWVKLTPSVLAYLNPYIDDLDLKHIKYFGFGGEVLP
ncbi:MAG: AMP-binding protein, partial [Mariniphaga sp.]|nr:AMP-binding protein [Mariniphaga sp.]